MTDFTIPVTALLMKDWNVIIPDKPSEIDDNMNSFKRIVNVHLTMEQWENEYINLQWLAKQQYIRNKVLEIIQE